ncbi:NAD(P)/FAD-dependent oxidoreductase [Nocardia sp. NPDC059246]|uniref:NAD(P)/FAD-dependent oxidoreductase n=1 Tax=unclassified Nocardia TaxID=2637762 RepID=UPI00367DCDDB
MEKPQRGRSKLEDRQVARHPMMSQIEFADLDSWETPAVVRQIVVVGGGPAAQRCVLELREIGFTGSVTLVSSESIWPYDGILLSKDHPEDKTASFAPMAGLDFCGERGVELLLGRKAVALDPVTRCVELADGAELTYDRLVLAVGGTPVLPRSLAAPGVLTMWTAADVGSVRRALERSGRVVVIGAGLLGVEIAAAAIAAGCCVTLVEAKSVPLEPVLGEEVGRLVGDLHASHGVDLRCGVSADRVTATADEYRVELADGTVLWSDSVIVCVGTRPAVDWLHSSGIAIDLAIMTDAECRTSLPGVLAAGACAQWWDCRVGDYCGVEHWDTAGDHGAAAARAALGRPAAFNPISFFRSHQYGVKFQWAANASRWDKVKINGQSCTDFSAGYFDGEYLVGAFVANRPKEFGALKHQLVKESKFAGPGKGTSLAMAE